METLDALAIAVATVGEGWVSFAFGQCRLGLTLPALPGIIGGKQQTKEDMMAIDTISPPLAIDWDKFEDGYSDIDGLVTLVGEWIDEVVERGVLPEADLERLDWLHLPDDVDEEVGKKMRLGCFVATKAVLYIAQAGQAPLLARLMGRDTDMVEIYREIDRGEQDWSDWMSNVGHKASLEFGVTWSDRHGFPRSGYDGDYVVSLCSLREDRIELAFVKLAADQVGWTLQKTILDAYNNYSSASLPALKDEEMTLISWDEFLDTLGPVSDLFYL